MRDEPKRWSSVGSEAPGALRDLLLTGREHVGSAGEVEGLRRRLAQVLPPNAGLGEAPLPRPSSALPQSFWMPSRWVRWMLGGVSTAAIVWLVARPRGEEAAPAPVPSVTAPSTPPAPASEPIALEPKEPAPVTPPAVAEVQHDPAEMAEPRVSKPRLAHPKPDEAELLRRAQAALAAHPSEALSLIRDHERRFARGALREEREVLAIEALRKLGRSAAAADRAARFEKSYPRSVHLEKVRGAK